MESFNDDKIFQGIEISENGDECEIKLRQEFKLKLKIFEGMMEYEILDKKKNLLTTGAINLYSIKEK